MKKNIDRGGKNILEKRNYFESVVRLEKNIQALHKQHTWHSYGRKAMLISFKVLILRAAIDLQISLNSSSGHTEIES